MIQVLLSDLSFQYDVHSLMKAFYPPEDVEILPIDETAGSDRFFRITEVSDTICCSYVESGKDRIERKTSIAGLSRENVKSALKRTLYDLLKEQTGHDLPWGTLTGIRPTKIAMKMLEEGAGSEQILRKMKEFYLASDEKARLSLRIAKLEKEILGGLHGAEGFSLYLSIPFCPTTCMYCSFPSYPIGRFASAVDDYLAKLQEEMRFVSGIYRGRALDSVYIGGGTPTTLNEEQMRRLNEMLRENFDFSTVAEYTMEAGRPDSITVSKLETMKEIGIDRISINPQTMHDETLKIIGRMHTVQQTVDAFHMARSVGFDNINMDVILGLPGEDEQMVSETFSKIRELDPDSLTVHSMALKRAAAMHTFLKDHPEIESINTPGMMELGMQCANDLKMQPYYLYRQKNMAGNFENVGYAKEGKYGLYNILIMEEVQPIAAVGAGTISKILFQDGRIERCANVKDVGLYLSDFEQVMQKKRAFYSRLEIES